MCLKEQKKNDIYPANIHSSNHRDSYDVCPCPGIPLKDLKTMEVPSLYQLNSNSNDSHRASYDVCQYSGVQSKDQKAMEASSLSQPNTNSDNPSYFLPSSKITYQTQDTICYTESKKGGSAMSLVGIMQNQNGIVAFGERKSTVNINGNLYPHGYTKKVFKGKDFVFVCSGFNEVQTFSGTIPLSDIIVGMHPNEFDGYEAFFQQLYDEIEKLKNNNSSFKASFLIGSKKKFKYRGKEYSQNMITECIFDEYPNYINYPGYSLRCLGFLDYMPGNIVVRENWSLDVLKNVAQNIVSSSIFFAEMILEDCSPIGGEIDIVVL